jgi:hypothetical protein
VGRAAVPYLTADATDGMGDPERGGFQFGIAGEFRFPAGDPAARGTPVQTVIDEMRARGLTTHLTLRELPGPREGGGAAELVSPKLSDSPRVWEDLDAVLEIVARHGGTVSPDSGGLARVGVEGYGTVTRRHIALLQLVRVTLPMLYRLETNPGSVRHRATGLPSPMPAEGFIESEPARRDLFGGEGGGLGAIVNLGPIVGRADDHIEFRLFDLSLDPGVTQARVKLVLALVVLARRLADEPGLAKRLGLHEFAFQTRDTYAGVVQRVRRPDGLVVPGEPTAYELTGSPGTERVVRALGMLFRRDEDIEQQLALAAVTRWPDSRAALADEQALTRLVSLARGSAVTLDGGGVTFPASPEAAEYLKPLGAGTMDRFQPERPYRVVLEITPDGVPTVFDGIEVSPREFVTLLRASGRSARLPGPGTGLVLVPVQRPGREPERSQPPAPDHWPGLLTWIRAVAAELATHVYVWVAANTHLRSVPETLLTEYQAFGRPELTGLLRNWRTEIPSAAFVLRHAPAGAPSPTADQPGPALIALPDGTSDDGPPLVDLLRGALSDLAASPEHPPGALDSRRFELHLEFVVRLGAPVAEREAALAAISDEVAAIGAVPWSLVPYGAGYGVTLVGRELTDTPETWHDLADVLAVVRRHGGAATPGTTGRLRCDLADYARRVECYEALVTLVAAHRSVLRRLNADPAAVRSWAPWHAPTIHAVDLVEFPPWDGSLDAAVVRTRSRICLGLAGAAGLLAGALEIVSMLPAEGAAGARRLIDVVRPRLTGQDQEVLRAHVEPRSGVGSWAGVHMVPIESGAIFGDPEVIVSPRYAATAATYVMFDEPTFVAGLGLEPRLGGPVVHGVGVPSVMPVSPERFAALLPVAGWRAGTAVALWFDEESPPDLPGLLAWTRVLAAALDVPVYLDVAGAWLLEVPERPLAGFELFARPDAVNPGVDWWLAPPPDIWLRYDPRGGSAPATWLEPLPDHRLREFTRVASWHGTGAGVVFAGPAELGEVLAGFETLDHHEGLASMVFARSRDGVPQVSVSGVARDLTPAELATVLRRHRGVDAGGELRLVVLDEIRPDADAWHAWVRDVAVNTGLTIHYPGPRTSVLITGRGLRRRQPHDYRVSAPDGADSAEPRWLVATPEGGTGASAFTDVQGWLLPVESTSGEKG